MPDLRQSLAEAKAGLHARVHTPEQIAARRGRPTKTTHKQPVTLRLDPEALAFMLQHEASKTADFSHVRVVLYGASPIPEDTLVKALGLLRGCQREIDVKHVGADNEGKFARLVATIPEGVAPVSLGYVSDTELSALYRQARFLAFPSRYEGFGLPVIEAQAHGTPVIASDIPVLREVAGDGAVYFPAGDASELARHMYALLNNDKMFSELSEKALQNQKRFSWHKAARQTEQVFTQLGCARVASQRQLN